MVQSQQSPDFEWLKPIQIHKIPIFHGSKPSTDPPSKSGEIYHPIPLATARRSRTRGSAPAAAPPWDSSAVPAPRPHRPRSPTKTAPRRPWRRRRRDGHGPKEGWFLGLGKVGGWEILQKCWRKWWWLWVDGMLEVEDVLLWMIKKWFIGGEETWNVTLSRLSYWLIFCRTGSHFFLKGGEIDRDHWWFGLHLFRF